MGSKMINRHTNTHEASTQESTRARTRTHTQIGKAIRESSAVDGEADVMSLLLNRPATLVF